MIITIMIVEIGPTNICWVVKQICWYARGNSCHQNNDIYNSNISILINDQ